MLRKILIRIGMSPIKTIDIPIKNTNFPTLSIVDRVSFFMSKMLSKIIKNVKLNRGLMPSHN